MKKTLLLSGLSVLTLLTAGCASTTTRSDVREARHNLRDAQRYGDRDDQRDARRELNETKRDYQDDHRCGPGYSRPC